MSLKIPTVLNKEGSIPKLNTINGNRQSANRTSTHDNIPVNLSVVNGIALEIDQKYRFLENYSVIHSSQCFECESGCFKANSSGSYSVSFTTEATNNVRVSGGHTIVSVGLFKNDSILHEVSESVLAVSNANKGCISVNLIVSLSKDDILRLAVKQSTDKPGIMATSSLTIIKI